MLYEKRALELLETTTLYNSEIAEIIHKEFALNVKLDSTRKEIGRIRTQYGIAKVEDREIVIENVKLARQKQKHQDKNRISNKSFREHARLENALEELGTALKSELKEHAKELRKVSLKPLSKKKSKGVGVIQVSDLHGNEMVDLPHNKFNFEVLSKRMKLYINECLDYFEYQGVNKVLFLLTGDMLNADRRLDEILNAATNRAKASILVVHIVKQALLEVLDRGFQIDFISVLGNESRIGQEMPYSQEGLAENYDFIVASHLKDLFEFAGIKGINFLSIDKVEEIVNVNGQKWLVAHDISQFTGKQEKSQASIGRYSLQGHDIKFLVGGHVHATRITDISSRSSSMVGSNSYNENALNLAGRAEGTCYVVKDGRRYVHVIDLQDISGVDGYEIVKALEAYNIKSATKLQPKSIIHKIVI